MLEVEFGPGYGAAERQLVHVLWLTSGLGCDGDSVAMTNATSPSLEDLLQGILPGMPRLAIYNPLLAYETGDEFMRAFFSAAAGELDPFILVLEGSVPNELISGDGHWAALGVDPETGDPITTVHLDRQARATRSGGAGAGHLRRLRRHPGDARTTRRARWGCATTSVTSWRLAPAAADRQPSGLPGPARQHHRDAPAPGAAPGRGRGDDRAR